MTFNTHVKPSNIGLNGIYFDTEDVTEACINLINETGDFTVIGWYKERKIIYRTLAHQESNKETSKYSLEPVAKVSSGKVVCYICIITPTNL